MNDDAKAFMNVLAQGGGLSKAEQFVICGFKGDPNDVPSHNWRPLPWRPGKALPFKSTSYNVYATISAFGRMPDGTFRRRKDTWKSGRALFIDDVNTKVHKDVVAALQPTAIVETSPDNFQYFYVLQQPERDFDRFDGIIAAFIRSKLAGADPGMAGITRVGRLPGFVNGKPHHGGFITRLAELDPKRLFTIDDLLKAFKLEIIGRRMPPASVTTDAAKERVRAYVQAYRWLERNKMLKRGGHADPSGWIQIHCPFLGEHSSGADNGSAIRHPAAENFWHGAFSCKHGHCIGRGWRQLTDWITERQAEDSETWGRRVVEP